MRVLHAGMMMAAKALLDENPDPTEEDVRWALSGNLCRCTGYAQILDAVEAAAEQVSAECPDADCRMAAQATQAEERRR